MNSLYKSLMGSRQSVNNGCNQNVETVKSIFGMLNGSANPRQLLVNIAAKNPMIKNIMDSADKSGKSYQDIFYELAEQKGIDPNSIINQLKF